MLPTFAKHGKSWAGKNIQPTKMYQCWVILDVKPLRPVELVLVYLKGSLETCSPYPQHVKNVNKRAKQNLLVTNKRKGMTNFGSHKIDSLCRMHLARRF